MLKLISICDYGLESPRGIIVSTKIIQEVAISIIPKMFNCPAQFKYQSGGDVSHGVPSTRSILLDLHLLWSHQIGDDHTD